MLYLQKCRSDTQISSGWQQWLNRRLLQMDSTSVLTERQLRNFNKKIKTSTTHSYNGTPCREWTGYRRGGYGRFGVNGELQSSHRISWQLAHGAIPEDKPCILHKCDNPPCCNALHLFPGTKRDNNDDRDTKGRTAKGEKSGTRRRPEAYAENRARGKKTRHVKDCRSGHP